MHIQAKPHSIALATPFVISRGARTHCHTVRVTVQHGEYKGVGECTPYPRYGESVESVIEQIQHWTEELSALSPIDAKQRLQQMPSGAARNALDCALWVLLANADKQTFPSPYFEIKPAIETAMTVSIGEPEAMAEQARGYARLGATLLKVKLDGEQVVERVKAVRHASLTARSSWMPTRLGLG
ncbi:muconate cycloisomerase [Vibrio ishigakensis]|uniref:Muconate cycloisomerase n=1 Tax=Vibrio ishigakensis TaxID=1481914 RepID=A0A0B8PKH0_9VIBR|nr:muconate cycloisomerase [Vibrio ishigakensis]